MDHPVVNVQFFSLDSLGNISQPLRTENILVETRSGNNKITTLDLRKYGIVFPENGLFVALENLLLDVNRLDLDNDGKVVTIYEPRIKVKEAANVDDTFYFDGSEWKPNKNHILILELSLE